MKHYFRASVYILILCTIIQLLPIVYAENEIGEESNAYVLTENADTQDLDIKSDLTVDNAAISESDTDSETADAAEDIEKQTFSASELLLSAEENNLNYEVIKDGKTAVLSGNTFSEEDYNEYGVYPKIPDDVNYYYENGTDKEAFYQESRGYEKLMQDSVTFPVTTTWSETEKNGVNVVFDLGGIRTVTRVDVWHSFSASYMMDGFSVELSIDGKNFVKADEVQNEETSPTAQTERKMTSSQFSPQLAKYVRVSIKKRTGYASLGVREIVILGNVKDVDLLSAIEKAKGMNGALYSETDIANLDEEIRNAEEAYYNSDKSYNYGNVAKNLNNKSDSMQQLYDEYIISGNKFTKNDCRYYQQYPVADKEISIIGVSDGKKLLDGNIESAGDGCVENSETAELLIDLNEEHSISGVNLWAQHSKKNGSDYKNISSYDVYTSSDGNEFVYEGSYENKKYILPLSDSFTQMAVTVNHSLNFSRPLKGRYVKITVKKAADASAFVLNELVLTGVNKKEEFNRKLSLLENIPGDITNSAESIRKKAEELKTSDKSYDELMKDLTGFYKNLSYTYQTEILSGNNLSSANDSYLYKEYGAAETRSTYTWDSDYTDSELVAADGKQALLNGGCASNEGSSALSTQWLTGYAKNAVCVFDLKKEYYVNRVDLWGIISPQKVYRNVECVLLEGSCDGKNYTFLGKFNNPNTEPPLSSEHYGMTMECMVNKARYIRVTIVKAHTAKQIMLNEIVILGMEGPYVAIPEFNIKSIRYTDVSGRRIRNLAGKALINVEADIKNYTYDNAEVTLVSELLTPKNELADITFNIVQIPAEGAARAKASFMNIPAEISDDYRIITFLVSNLKEMKGLTESIAYDNKPQPTGGGDGNKSVVFDGGSSTLTVSGKIEMNKRRYMHDVMLEVYKCGKNTSDTVEATAKTLRKSIDNITQCTPDENGNYQFNIHLPISTGRHNYRIILPDGTEETGYFLCINAEEDLENKIIKAANGSDSASLAELIRKYPDIFVSDGELYENLNKMYDNQSYIDNIAEIIINGHYISCYEISEKFGHEMAVQYINASENKRESIEKYAQYIELDNMSPYITVYNKLEDSEKDEVCNAVKNIKDAEMLKKAVCDNAIIRKIKKISNWQELKTLIVNNREYLEGLSKCDAQKEDSVIKNVSLRLDEINSTDKLVDIYNEEVRKANTVKRTEPGGGGSGGGKSSSAGKTIFTPPVIGPEENNSPEMVFDDVPEDHWAKDSILELYNKGIIQGKGNGKFEPNMNISREEFVVMIVRALNIKGTNQPTGFEDTDNNTWYASAVAAAYENGIINGIDDTKFGIGLSITRQDIAAIAFRAAKTQKIVKSDTDSVFTDDHGIAPYARDAVYSMRNLGIISGMPDGSFAPQRFATRAECAKILASLIKL